jgi:hypothetical protein
MPPFSHNRGRPGKNHGRKKRDNNAMSRPGHKIFADQLKLLMREHKPPMVNGRGEPSATQLARFTGINKTTLDNYIKGKRHPHALRVPHCELF